MGDKRQISIVVEKGANHAVHPVNGVFGALREDKTLVVHFCFDYPTVANIVTIEIDDETGEQSKTDEVKLGDMTRSIRGSFAMTAETAKEIGQFLLDHGTAADDWPESSDPESSDPESNGV